LVSLVKKNNANFHVLGLFIPKNEFRAKKKFRLPRGVASLAVGFWTKFETQLAQPCLVLESWNFGYKPYLTHIGLPHTQNFEIQLPKGSHPREVFRGFAV
jgi:hypothetical protein